MSQQQRLKKLEEVFDLFLSENSEQASELLHQIIIEKSRVIYESLINEESDEVGGDPDEDFTAEISSDETEIDTDEQNDGEADDSEYDDEADDSEFDSEADDAEGSTEDRIEDLESQLADLRAEFDALMGEEMQEPNHADLAADFDSDVEPAMDDSMDDGMADSMPDFGGPEEKVVGEVVAQMFEKESKGKLAVAPQAKKQVKGNRADEETQFLSKVADTGQKGTAKLVGTGKNTPLGAEQTKSSFTNIPPRKDYGGKPTNILGSNATGGEYGKYNGDSASDDTPSDNVKVEPKKSGVKADTTAKYTGGKSAGPGFTKSPLTKKPA